MNSKRSRAGAPPAASAPKPSPAAATTPPPAISPAAQTPAHEGAIAELLASTELSWFLLLLPGFVLVSVMGIVTDRPEWSDLQFTAFSLMGSALCLGITLPLYLLLRYLGSHVPWRAAVQRSSAGAMVLPATIYFMNFALAAALGAVIGSALEHDAAIHTINDVLHLELDKRSWMRPSKFVLQNNHDRKLIESGGDGRTSAQAQGRAWVRFIPKEGTSYEGFPLLQPHGNDMTELYLTPACRKDKDAKAFTPLPGPGVLLPLDKFTSIELLDEADNECFKQVYEKSSCLACEACATKGASPSAGVSVGVACHACAMEAFQHSRSRLIELDAATISTAVLKVCEGLNVCAKKPQDPVCSRMKDCLKVVGTLVSSPRCVAKAASAPP